MRRVLLTLLLALATAPAAAVAQLPEPPPLPPVPALPLPLPPLPAPAPAPTLPSVPAPAPAPTIPSVPARAPTVPQAPAVAAPADSSSTPAAGGRSGGQTSRGQTSDGTSAGPSQSSGRTAAPKRRPSVVLAFRASASGRTAIRLRQVAPVCRSAGRLLVPSRSGPNRFRFNGRVSGRPLRDGTYVATTPSGTVRFAIVKGKPTRSPGSSPRASATPRRSPRTSPSQRRSHRAPRTEPKRRRRRTSIVVQPTNPGRSRRSSGRRSRMPQRPPRRSIPRSTSCSDSRWPRSLRPRFPHGFSLSRRRVPSSHDTGPRSRSPGRSACSWSSSCTGPLCSNRLAYSGGFNG